MNILSNMKYKSGFLALLLLLTAVGCSKDPKENVDKPQIKLTGSIAEAADAEYPFTMYALPGETTTWANLYIDGSSARVMKSGENGKNEIHIDGTYQWPASGKLHFFGVMGMGDAGTNNSTVKASGAGKLTLTAGEGVAYDYLISNNLTADEFDIEPKMEFRHLMAQLTVKIVKAADVTDDPVVTMDIPAGKKTGTYDMFSDVKVITPDEDDYTIAYDGETTGQGAANPDKVYHLVPDGSTLTEVKNVRFDGSDGADFTITNKGGVSNKIFLTSGVNYELTVTVTNKGIESVEIEPGDWTTVPLPGSTVGLDMESEVLKVILDANSTGVDAVEITTTDDRTWRANIVDGESEGTMTLPAEADAIKAVTVWSMNDMVEVPAELFAYDAETKELTVNLVLVSTAEQMVAINTDDATRRKHYRQVADIDLGGAEWTPIGTHGATTDLQKPFRGTFEGAGHGIKNLSITGTANYVGLFGANTGTLSGINIVSGSVSGGSYVGSVSGRNTGTITGCRNAASVAGTTQFTGGVCGYNLVGTITGSFNKGMITGGNYTGGVVGYNYGTVSGGSYNTGNVSGTDNIGGITGYNILNAITGGSYNTGKVSGGNNIGGICGQNYHAEVSGASYNTGEVSGNLRVGGICGWNQGLSDTDTKVAEISGGCYNAGKVSGAQFVGGIAGHHETQSGSNKAVIDGCYNTGVITGTATPTQATVQYTGGICGYSLYATVTGASYNKGKVTGALNTAGVAGYNYGGTIAGASYNTGEISGTENVGGVAGNNTSSIAGACYNGGAVSGATYTGGVAGRNTGASANINGCYNDGAVTGTGSNTGGVAGYNLSGGTITSCYNAGTVSGANFTGGITGSNASSITAIYNVGSVAGKFYVGGIVGYAYDGSTVVGSYNIGAITGNAGYIGAVCGLSSITLTNAYWGGASASMVGVGNGSSVATKFGDGTGGTGWPETSDTGWTGTYWKPFGTWADSGSQGQFPKLIWQQ